MPVEMKEDILGRCPMCGRTDLIPRDGTEPDGSTVWVSPCPVCIPASGYAEEHYFDDLGREVFLKPALDSNARRIE